MTGEPHYLEIVTPDVDGVCTYYERAVGVSFDEPLANLGGARVAVLPSGARLGVRGPLRDDEGPLWRVYLRVDDLDAAITAARLAGAFVALEGMSLGDEHGRIGIVIHGGVEHGLWETPRSAVGE